MKTTAEHIEKNKHSAFKILKRKKKKKRQKNKLEEE
jgi:hypothetical protein